MLNFQDKIALQSGTLDDVRSACAYVAHGAKYVRINESMLDRYALELPSYKPFNLLDTRRHFIGDMQQTASYVLALDTINFGSGYQVLMEHEGARFIDDSIYFTLSMGLKNYYEARGALGAQEMAQITKEKILQIFSLPHEGHFCREFAALCAQSLNELGHFVLSSYDGDFLKLIEAAEGSAEKLAAILAGLESYQDIHEYHGHPILFYKRAQIAAADLHLAFGHLKRELFGDIERLTMFADNAVPHVLRADGILEYDPELAARIDSGIEIESGSAAEIEIRACALHAVELIAARKPGFCAMNIDHLLWHRSVEDARYTEKPAHRTLSRFY